MITYMNRQRETQVEYCKARVIREREKGLRGREPSKGVKFNYVHIRTRIYVYVEKGTKYVRRSCQYYVTTFSNFNYDFETMLRPRHLVVTPRSY